ncbi:Zinc finger CCCH domain-containing protein 18 [Sesamum angolense]|uniref:Zinc finger CCCH domain-containing protein 18 n=1 Tax=Sesamum angolense TaxID=2727404 RepID=A0AAE1WWS8_9LAMI|nr:Zinc finger CCCH domain-containing protein 18 [Sesamum angolense]
MADEDEERVVEEQLHFQLNEQKESLAAVADALSSDPSNPELLSVHVELVQAIKDAEEGLFQLKRARLLREADSVLQASLSSDDVKVEPLDPTDVEAEPLVDESYSVGSKCRFRHTDGRWYNGLIVGLEGSESAKISFLTPTSESMLMCKFFQQQRCRFGSNCRLSHGIDIPLSSLTKYIPTTWEQSLVGSSIWALSDSKSGIWREAELESLDEELRICEMSDEVESDTSYEESDSSDYENDSPQGLGFLESTTLQRGVQTETAIFAKWENHTRGIASKMMANMGYREGMGLGASGQGMLDPVSVRVLPPKQSLDHAVKTLEKEENKETRLKKRTRGGKRKRDKKLAAAARAAEEEEESKDVFSLINTQLAMHGQILNSSSTKKQQSKANGEAKKEDRRALLAYEDEIKNLKLQIEKLEEMANRNRKEKVVYDAALRKLNETRKALADAEEAHASTSNAGYQSSEDALTIVLHAGLGDAICSGSDMEVTVLGLSLTTAKHR